MKTAVASVTVVVLVAEAMATTVETLDEVIYVLQKALALDKYFVLMKMRYNLSLWH